MTVQQHPSATASPHEGFSPSCSVTQSTVTAPDDAVTSGTIRTDAPKRSGSPRQSSRGCLYALRVDEHQPLDRRAGHRRAMAGHGLASTAAPELRGAACPGAQQPSAPAGSASRRAAMVRSVMVTTHVLAGALIGIAGQRRVVPAFAAGFASHLVLDAVPHWGRVPTETFFRVAVADGLIALLVICVVVCIIAPGLRPAVVAAIAGAALPDIDKPARLFLGRSPFPSWFDTFHGSIQDEAPDRLVWELIAVVALTVMLAFVVRHDRWGGSAQVRNRPQSAEGPGADNRSGPR